MASAQNKSHDFLSEYSRAGVKEKVAMLSELNFSEYEEILPAIKDSIRALKGRIYNNTSSKEAKFLIDKIEAKQFLFEKRYKNAAMVLENSLANNALTVDDSLYCYSNLRSVYINLNYLSKAVEANILHDKLAIRSTNPEISKSFIQKSRIYDLFGLYKQAIIEKRREYNEEVINRKNDTDYIASYLNDMGVYYNRLKNADSAIPYFVRASELITRKLSYSARKDHYKFFKGLIEGNMALAFTYNGEYKKAIPYLISDCYNSLKVNDELSAFNSYIVLSRCYIRTGNLHLAQRYADTACLLSDKLNRPITSLRTFQLLGELNNSLGNYQLAAKNLQAYISLKDSITQAEKELQLLNQQVALDIETKDLEIEEKTKLLQGSQVREAKQKAFRAYLIAGLIILLILIIVLFYSNQHTRKREEELELKNEKINKQNKQIEIALREKDILLKEVHHRVKNNLQIISSIINLHMDKISDKKVKGILNEIKLRISSIALTHQMLYQKGTISDVNLQEYIKNLCDQINNSFENENIKLNVNIPEDAFSLAIDIAIPLGLLVNEIVTNSFKHAFPEGKSGSIIISAFTKGKQVMIEIKDNGVGISNYTDEMLDNPKSLGFELIKILIDQLDGELKIDTGKDGTSFKMIIRV